MHAEEMPDSRFVVYRLLGTGGCAAVYDAFDKKRSRRVALKVLADGGLDCASVARLAREARTGLALNHPNVCTVHGAGLLDDGRPYVAMELLSGKTLRAYLGGQGALSAEEAIEVAVQVLSGLEAAHSLGVVHRDVKPENIFMTWDGPMRVKLLDFGLCRRARDAIDECTLTIVGDVVGTPGYFAPEQLGGGREIDPRTDLFAVGLVLFEMLAGRPAYRGADALRSIANLAIRPIPSLRSLRNDLPTSLDRITAHATERDPRSRYASAARFLHDLLEARTALRRKVSRSGAVRSAANPRLQLDPDAPTLRLTLRGALRAPGVPH